MVSMDGTPTITPNGPASPGPSVAAGRKLRTKIDEFVGIVFYGELLKAMQNNPLKGKYGHGGRGEEVFAGQLHQELAQRAGRARSSPLSDAIYKRYIRQADQMSELEQHKRSESMRLLEQTASARVAENIGSISPPSGTLSLIGRR